MEDFFKVVEHSKLSNNILLKHLVVLSDFSGEMLQRVNKEFEGLFPSNTLHYTWGSQSYSYQFAALPVQGNLNNDKLGISGKRLLDDYPINDLFKDVAVLLLFGSSAIEDSVAEVLARCEIGGYLGKPEQLTHFVKQRYIWVSSITRGARANTLGHIAQQFVAGYVKRTLGLDDTQVQTNGHLPGVTHTEANSLTTFDLVASRNGKYAAIEVSFQVTTNSTIERKAGQAMSRFEQAEAAGHKIAYVIDGAGNFQRENAIGTLCSFSHCTVAFTESELEVLCEFLSLHLDS